MILRCTKFVVNSTALQMYCALDITRAVFLRMKNNLILQILFYLYLYPSNKERPPVCIGTLVKAYAIYMQKQMVAFENKILLMHYLCIFSIFSSSMSN